MHSSPHLLKLVTGVEISTRAVNRSGRPGKEEKRRSRTAAAAPKMAAFLLSIVILNINGERKKMKAQWVKLVQLLQASRICPRDGSSRCMADNLTSAQA